MTINDGVSKQFERKLSSFADELHLNPFQCRLFSTKLSELESQPLTKRNRRSEFARWVHSCIERSHAQSFGSGLSKFDPLGFDRNGTEYRVMRIYDETFGLRSSFPALIDSYYDESKILPERALKLIAFMNHAATQDGPSSLLVYIKSFYNERKISASQAGKLIDLMERLPSSLLSSISNWYVEKNISGKDAIILIILAVKALTPPDSENAMSLEELPFFSEKEPMNSMSAEFATRLVGLKQAKGIPIRKETIALFAQLVHCIGEMKVPNKKEWFQYFFDKFMKCVRKSNASIKSEHLQNWDHYLDSQKSGSNSDAVLPLQDLFIPKVERDAYSYWLPRTFDEIYGDRSSYDNCIDMLYEDGLLTMSTANKIIALPSEVDDDSVDPFFRFSQKLCAIRQPKTLPERFSEEVFKLILNHYQGS